MMCLPWCLVTSIRRPGPMPPTWSWRSPGNKEELATVAAPALVAARRDKLAWIAYPKAGQLGTDLNRDILARELTGQGVQPVRQVAIDEAWSALRFRPA